MQISKSIEHRVFLIFGSFALVLSLIYSGTSILIAYVVEDALLDKIVAIEAEFIQRNYQSTGTLVSPRVDYMSLYAAVDQAPLPVKQALLKTPKANEVFTDSNVHYHIQYLDIDVQKKPLLVAEVTPLLIVTNVSGDIFLLMILVLVLGLVLSLCLAYAIARRTTKPIKVLAGEVMTQRQQDDPLVLSSTRAEDEIGYLARTIENTLNNLKSAVLRESEFTRDVSHELRTPLTVIKNTLALGKQRDWTQDDVYQLNNSANKMDKTVTILLALARAESVELETFPLRPLLEECILSQHHRTSDLKFNIELDLPDQFEVLANPQLVTLLANNLIENAIEHASRPELTIRLLDEQLLFENPTDRNIEENIIEPQVKDPASPGLGQGLFLVSRIIGALKWEFKIASREHNYCFLIAPRAIKK